MWANCLAIIRTCVCPNFSVAISTQGSYSLNIMLNISIPESAYRMLETSLLFSSSLQCSFSLRQRTYRSRSGIFRYMLLIDIYSRATDIAPKVSSDRQYAMSQCSNTYERRVRARMKEVARVSIELTTSTQQNSKSTLRKQPSLCPFRVQFQWRGNIPLACPGCYRRNCSKSFNFLGSSINLFSNSRRQARHLRMLGTCLCFLKSLGSKSTCFFVKSYPALDRLQQKPRISVLFSTTQHYQRARSNVLFLGSDNHSPTSSCMPVNKALTFC